MDDFRYHFPDWHDFDSPEKSRNLIQSSISRLTVKYSYETVSEEHDRDPVAIRSTHLQTTHTSPAGELFSKIANCVSIDGHLSRPHLHNPRQLKRKFSGEGLQFASLFDQNIETPGVDLSTICSSVLASTTSPSNHQTAISASSSIGHYSDADDSPAPSKRKRQTSHSSTAQRVSSSDTTASSSTSTKPARGQRLTTTKTNLRLTQPERKA